MKTSPTHTLRVMTPAPWLMPRINRYTMETEVEAGIVAHYRAHPKAVEALPEPFRTRMLTKITNA